MEHKHQNLLSSCAQMDFGRIPLTRTERAFYKRFNAEILSLCRSLPNSVQTDALLFLMRYSGVNLGQELDFFSNYYPPAWSILYWLSHEDTFAKRLKARDMTSAVTAQSMAMFLHSLDDHLTDNQISVSPLTLLLRSQAWTIMNQAFCNLSEDLPGGTRKLRRLVDDYYAGILDSEGLTSLDSYCHRFRKQMALGMVAPILLSMKVAGRSDFTNDLQIAYGSFGISWRLLDDIRDIGNDMKRGSPSAIYLCLPKKIRAHWNTPGATNRTGAGNSTKPILNHILECGLIERIKDIICTELETAASIVEKYELRGFARELRYLVLPLRSSSRP